MVTVISSFPSAFVDDRKDPLITFLVFLCDFGHVFQSKQQQVDIQISVNEKEKNQKITHKQNKHLYELHSGVFLGPLEVDPL